MSFRVNTNISANNALRNLGVTSADLSRSITRLSTGLRINNAADDPAGLIASESFRAQIGGIDQAMRNSQNAISYAKTAEGALDEVNRLLRDARALAVAAGNTGTLSESQIQANQNQYNSIVSSITRIAMTTQFGTRKLLNGSAGISSSVTSGTNIRNISLTGEFAGAAITANSIVTAQVTTSARKAIVTGTRTFALLTTTVSAGAFTLNGHTFTTSATDTIGSVVARINSASRTTGVVASFTAGSGLGVSLQQQGYGSAERIDFADAHGVLLSAAGTLASVGTDAVATVVVNQNGTGTLSTVTFNAGRGLNLRDSTGNSIILTENGNLNLAATAVGQINLGSAQFQIGADSGQTSGLALGNFDATQLGTASNLTTAQGASQTRSNIDTAIDVVTASRAAIGSFLRNTLETNIRSLGLAKESLASSESIIRDADIAEEMTKYTKVQILQQAGISVLSQANVVHLSVLSLLR